MSEEKKKYKTLAEREASMLKVTDDYLLDIDEDNITVRKKGVNQALGYFGKVESALTFILDNMKKNKLSKDAKNLEDAVAIIKATNDEFSAVIKSAFPEYEIVKAK